MLHDQHPKNKSIMVSLLGRPNAGKSTLINYLLGFDLSIVSNKPQTTRNSFHCTFTVDRTEVILVDTPGIHQSAQEMNIRMNGQTKMSLDGVDLNLILIDGSALDIETEYKTFQKDLGKDLSKSWVVFTKSDIAMEKNWDSIFEKLQAIDPKLEKYFIISAKDGSDVHLLTGALCDEAPFGPHHYPKGDVSNKNMRFFAAEYIREQVFRALKEEVPYEVAVVIDDFHDIANPESKTKAKILATILVNRPSQRAIVIGAKGSMVKRIGALARKKIEALVGGQVHLVLHVKVSQRWFKNNFVLEEIGLPRVQSSKRVWRRR